MTSKDWPTCAEQYHGWRISNVCRHAFEEFVRQRWLDRQWTDAGAYRILVCGCFPGYYCAEAHCLLLLFWRGHETIPENVNNTKFSTHTHSNAIFFPIFFPPYTKLNETKNHIHIFSFGVSRSFRFTNWLHWKCNLRPKQNIDFVTKFYIVQSHTRCVNMTANKMFATFASIFFFISLWVYGHHTESETKFCLPGKILFSTSFLILKGNFRLISSFFTRST